MQFGVSICHAVPIIVSPSRLPFAELGFESWEVSPPLDDGRLAEIPLVCNGMLSLHSAAGSREVECLSSKNVCLSLIPILLMPAQGLQGLTQGATRADTQLPCPFRGDPPPNKKKNVIYISIAFLQCLTFLMILTFLTLRRPFVMMEDAISHLDALRTASDCGLRRRDWTPSKRFDGAR